MPIGRNDPCPCGSGKKYKLCHGPVDAEREQRERRLGLVADEAPADRRRLSLPADAEVPDLWEIDLVPLLASLEDDPAARLVAVLVVAGEFVLHAGVLDRPPAEPEELAPVVADAVAEAIAVAGKPPAHVRLRHASVAAALAPLVAPKGIQVATARDLPAADVASRSMREHISGGDPRIEPASHPRSWAGWRLRDDQVARLHAASAAYYRAAPWTTTVDDEQIRATLPNGDAWNAIVLGNAGEEFGLALYASMEDLEDLYADEDPPEALTALRDAVIALTFAAKDDIDAITRKEIRKASWDIAGPAAYPVLMVLGTPGGGLTPRQADDLIALLEAIPRFIAAGGSKDSWIDPESGATLAFVRRPSEPEDYLWPLPDSPTVSGPEGPGARPGARIADVEERATGALKEQLLAAFTTFLTTPAEGPRLARATAEQHARAVVTFVDFLFWYQQIPPEAITEYDLRDFLYRWYPRKVMDTEAGARALPGALEHFFHFLERARGVRCPWAEAILEDRDAFMDRWHERRESLGDPDAGQRWDAELTLDLDARLFLPMSGHGTGIEWGDYAGEVEAALFDELLRLWLAWRDELIRSGAKTYEDLVGGLLEREMAWAKAPNALAKGKSPARAIAREQARMGPK
jgi:hypothetical protein